jgi:hypothetical protein
LGFTEHMVQGVNEGNLGEHIVQAVQEGFPKVMQAVVDTAKSIPLRKRDVVHSKDKDGKQFIKKTTYDMERRYDEATFRIYERSHKMGHTPLRIGENDPDACIDTSFWGFMLGIAYGLQYNPKQKGECYGSVETTVTNLEQLWLMSYYVFLPTEWAKLQLATQDLTDVTSAFYSKCELQQAFKHITEMLSYEGLIALSVRVTSGITGEIPFYFTKFSESDRQCIQGQSAGKLAQILADYSI